MISTPSACTGEPERNTNLERQALEKNSGRASPRPIIYDLGSHVTPHCCQTLFVGCTWGWLAGCVRSLRASLLCSSPRLPATSSAAPPIEPIAAIRSHNSGRLLFFWLSHTSAEATSLVASFRAPGGGAARGRPPTLGMWGRDMGAAWVGFRCWQLGIFLPAGPCGSVSCCCYRGGTEHSVCFIGFGAWQNYFQMTIA